MQTKNKLAISVVLVAAITLASGFWQIKRFADTPLAISKTTIYRLAPGTSRAQLADQLVSQHLIPNRRWFGWLLKIEPNLAKFKAGSYRLEPGNTVRQFLELLASGKEAQFPLRLIEGQRLQEWLKQVRQAPYLRHDLPDDKPSSLAKALEIPEDELEGNFYPDTYLYTAERSDISLLKAAHQRMQRFVNQLWQQRDNDLPYQTPAQLVTMASIIEKETAVNDERAKVASVLINRLRQGIRLQTDPTVIYGMGTAYKGSLSRKDLATPTAYNTYIITGLPPSPIAIPSKASLEAAAHPATTKYLYFVANGNGGHTFTTDLVSHNKAVQQWRQLEAKANKEGYEK